uniref:Uncharacterized protein n=1 Tax=Arundo donax TaxID=35708 RepID=A0A0A8Z7D3_ARUDO
MKYLSCGAGTLLDNRIKIQVNVDVRNWAVGVLRSQRKCETEL